MSISSRRAGSRFRILGDHNVSHYLILQFQAAGYDAVHMKKRLPHDASDEKLFDYARQDGRVIITNDKDFLDLHRFDLSATAGVVVLPTGNDIRDVPGKNDLFGAAFAHIVAVGPQDSACWRGRLAHYQRTGHLVTYQACRNAATDAVVTEQQDSVFYPQP